MPKITDLVTGLGAGWKIVGTGVPIEEVNTIPNPMAANPIAPANTPPTVTQGTGRYYVIAQDPEGHQRAVYMKADQIKGGLVLRQSGLNDTVPAQPGDPADPKGTGSKPNPSVFTGDLTQLDWTQAGAIGDVPPGEKTPTATSKLDKIDARGNVIAPTDTTTKVTQMRDPATGTVINLPTDPAGTLHEMGDDLLLIKPDGSYTTVTSRAAKPTTTSVAGVGLVEYDPSKPAGQRSTVLIAAPKDASQQVFKTVNGKTWVYNAASGDFIESNLPADTEVGYTYNDPNSKWIVFADKQGKEISRMEKPDWKPEPKFQAGQAGAADLVAAKIPTINPTSGALEFVDNQSQVKASDATSELAKTLGLQVAAGSMSEKQAQDLITSAIATMNAQTAQAQAQAQQAQTAAGAAQNVLSAQQQGAQTGAGLFQQRQQTAQGLVQQGLGIATSTGGRYGNYSGGMLSPVPGAGQALVQGAAGFATEMGGGQAVYDTAARMVQAADPNNQNPDRAQAIGVLSHIMNHYQQSTGQEFPTVTATKALQQSQQTGGMAAPGAAPLLSPQPVVSGNPAFAAGGAGPVMAGQFTAPPALAAGQPAATFMAPPLAVNNLTNLDPRLRGAVY